MGKKPQRKSFTHQIRKRAAKSHESAAAFEEEPVTRLATLEWFSASKSQPTRDVILDEREEVEKLRRESERLELECDLPKHLGISREAFDQLIAGAEKKPSKNVILDERDELEYLRRERERLKLECALLRKAAIVLAEDDSVSNAVDEG